MYLACSFRMLRSCCTSSAAALGSVRQALGTSATGGFGFCSSGAGWGTGCFCRLDRIRSLAAKPSTQRPRIKESNRCFLLQSKLCLARFTQHFQSQAKVSAKYHCQGWRCRWSLEFGSVRKLARSALFPTGTEPLSHRTACAPRPHIPATVPTDDHSRNSWCKTAIKPDWPVTVTADKLRQTLTCCRCMTCASLCGSYSGGREGRYTSCFCRVSSSNHTANTPNNLRGNQTADDSHLTNRLPLTDDNM